MDKTVDALEPLLGHLLDERYRIDAVIAHGGMATVYTATDTRLDRIVAVKVMRRALAEDPEFVARFNREARASARLSTPEVVAIHDQGRDRETGLAYLVMEHVKGINVRQLLQERGALTPSRAVALLEPVLRALGAAHDAGLVHRDVKPENVLLADDGRVKVADFGLARAVETSNLTQTTGLLIGTVAYLAPEQVTTGSADARTDVYAAGVLLWELLTGTPPYSGDSPLSVAYRHVNDDVPPPSTAVEGIPPTLDDLVVRATRRDPAARPVDGNAFLAELRAVKADLPPVDDEPVVRRSAGQPTLVVPLPAATPAPATVPRARKRRRKGLIATAIVLVLALVALGGGYYLGSYRYTTAPGVLGLEKAAATKQLTGAGFVVALAPDKFSEAIKAGLVLTQDPAPAGRLRKDGTITLTVSKGADRRRVPTLAGSNLDQATVALRAVGLVVGTLTKEFSNDVTAGAVLRSDPVAGVALKPGTTVQLVLSRGAEPLPIPDVRGAQKAAATATLTKAGFVVTTETVFSDTVAAGLVLDQSPSKGTAVRGSTVSLTVSKGPDLVAVPKVTGKHVDDATSLLAAAGLKANVNRPFPGGPGRVLQQNPGDGSKVKRGSTVTLFVF